MWSSGRSSGARTVQANAVRLQLHALAYNLANFLRTLALPTAIADWSLTSLREKVVKLGAKVIAHGRYLVFQMAEVAMPHKLFWGSSSRSGGTPSRRGAMLTPGRTSTSHHTQGPSYVRYLPDDRLSGAAVAGRVDRLPTQIWLPGARNSLSTGSREGYAPFGRGLHPIDLGNVG
jgi:hypothetical protein